ncbi:ABC transporter substrate-binding protein [Massilia sp. TS11]|uniref:substrate-binding periplasmic protein n=1 Tax=Massilia sp. TS11 TaxID=2908003 RepID=UPI001EDC6449|nr:transporter substrate-binding domain-containing protein [Massilia sp. TS11]MCG2585615.1 transporter substrate-binding domain-containing protein [Massilia sp. TS11]
MLKRFLPLLLACVSVSASAEAPLRLLLTETVSLIRPGADGVTPEGPAVDLLRQALQRAQIQATLELVPTARRVDGARTTPLSCAVGLQRVPANEDQFKWVGPVSQDNIYLFGAPDFRTRVRSITDVQKLPVGAVRGSVLTQLLRDYGIAVDEAVDLKMNIRKLMAHRVALIPISSIEMAAMRESPDAVKLKQVFKLLELRTWIGCHPSVNSEALGRLQRVVDAQRQAGELRLLGL